MNFKINRHKKRIIKRGISLAVAFAVLLNELVVWNLLNNVPIIGDVEKQLSITAKAAEDPGDDPRFVHDGNNEIEVEIEAFVEYSEAAQIYSLYHQHDKIVIVATNVSDYYESGFQGIGTATYPFAGSIEISSNTSTTLNLDAPLFNYVYDSIVINNGNPLPVSRYYQAYSDVDETTPIIAKNVICDPASETIATWKIDLTKPSDSDDHYLASFGGFVGNMCYDEENDKGAKVNVEITLNQASPDVGNIAINGSNDTGLACGHMEKKTALGFTINGDRKISSISTSSGDVGGLVGEMEDGSILTVNGSDYLDSGVGISTSNGYAGGIVGKNTGADVSFNFPGAGEGETPITAYPVQQYMSGTLGAGGIYGYYKPLTALVSTTVDDEIVDNSFDISKYSINCRVNGMGSTGGLFGMLETEVDVSISGSGTVTSNHAEGSSGAFGGLIGLYKTDSIARTLTIGSVIAAPSKGGTANYYGGGIGKIDDTVASYVRFSGFTANASNAGTLTFGGAVASADNAFVDINGVTVTATDFKGGGLVGSLDHGVLRLDGTVNLTGATPATPTKDNNTDETNDIGKVVGWRDDALVFAKSTCTLTKPATTVDDIGSWGQVIIFKSEDTTDVAATAEVSAYKKTSEKLGNVAVLSVNENMHSITIEAPTTAYTSIENVADYAKTALCFQIDADNNSFISFSNTDYAHDTIKSANITLKANVDLTNTGFVNLTRDNNVSDADKCTYSATFDGKPLGTQYSVTYGGATVYRHSYTGLFGIASNAVINNTTFEGSLNVDAKEAIMYAGSAAGNATGTFNASGLIVNTTINHAGGSTLYVGGVLGEASSSIGNITVSDITANAEITGAASDTCLGGVIGKISHNTITSSVTWAFSDIEISGSISNTAALDNNRVGGLVASISGGKGVTSRTLDLNRVTVKDLDISVKAKSNGSVGGVLGYSWLSVNTDFDDVKVGTSTTVQGATTVTTPSITQSDNSATGVDFAGVVYQGTGYWTFTGADDLKINAFKLNSENAQSFGMIINKGWAGSNSIDSALYLELQTSDAYSITAGNLGFKMRSDGKTDTDMTIPVFDELVAHTAFYTGSGASKVAYSWSDPDNLYILQNGQSVVSIQTSGTGGGLTMNVTSASGTYTPATSFGKQMIPYARYYYNLYTIKSATGNEDMLMSLGAKWYAHTSIEGNVSSNDWGTTVPDATYDMAGYSWYPLNIDSAAVMLNGTFKLYNKEFENSETAAATADSAHATRTSLYNDGTTQHYLLHSALFNNVGGSLSVGTTSFKLQGSVPQIDTTRTVGESSVGRKYSGALVLGTVRGSGSTDAATAKVITSNVKLDGIYVYNFTVSDDTDYAPLLIDRTSDYSTLTIKGVSVDSNSSYKTNNNVQLDSASNPKAATSLIGNVGDDKNSQNVNVSFSGISLDGRKTNLGLTALDSAYHTDGSIFTKATLLNKLSFNTGKGTYTFKIADDWNSSTPVHNVTYGKEVGYTAADTSTQYYGQENWYLDTNPGTYVNATINNDSTGAYLATFKESYQPYVYTPYDSANNYYQLEVNHGSATFGGCGTYNDPYILTSEADFQTIYDILANETYSSQHKIYLPMKSAAASDLGATWDKPEYDHKQYVYDTDDKCFYLGGVSTGEKLEVEKVRTYVAGAYFKISPANNDDGTVSNTITISNSEYFKGFGNTKDNYAQFRGVIVGTGIETIVNETGYPLIAISNGSVVKDVNITVNSTREITQDSAKSFSGEPLNANSYGAVMGTILGGDNIIDGVSVTFQSGSSITLSGSHAQLVPVGGYVGVIEKGGLIFRGMEGKTTGISGIPSGVVTAGTTPGIGDTSLGDMTAETNMRWLYVNPIIGRVINGYAVTEASAYRPYEDGTRVYRGGTTDEVRYWDETTQTEVTTAPASLSHVTMRNGNKHYSIADIKSAWSVGNTEKRSLTYTENDVTKYYLPDDEKLDCSNNNNEMIPNAQSFFLMSVMVNSGMRTNINGYNDVYQIPRWGQYDEVGSNASNASGSDWYTYAQNEYLGSDKKVKNSDSTKYGYIAKFYTKHTKLENIKKINTKLTLTGSDDYYLPDGYKGIGNLYLSIKDNDNYKMSITSFVGNGKTISMNSSYYYYYSQNGNDNTEFDSSYAHMTDVGFGLFNSQNGKTNSTSNRYYNFIITGNIVCDCIDNTSSKGEHIYYYGHNEGAPGYSWDSGIDRSQMVSVGGLIGTSTNEQYIDSVSLQNVYIKGIKCTGGLIGLIPGSKTTYRNTVPLASKDIKVYGAGTVGGMIGKSQNGQVDIDNGNVTYSITDVASECQSRDKHDYNYGVGGFIGYCRGSGETAMKIKNVTVGTIDQKRLTTVRSDDAEIFTGGLIGISNKAKLDVENCTIYNQTVTSKYMCGGLLGYCATAGGDSTITNTNIYCREGLTATIRSTNSTAAGFLGAGKNDVHPVIIRNSSIENYSISANNYAGGAVGYFGHKSDNSTVKNTKIRLENFLIENCLISVSDSDGAAGGLVGYLCKEVNGEKFLYGYNILEKNLTYSGTSIGSVCGKTQDKSANVIKLAGFSRQDDRGSNNSLISALVGSPVDSSIPLGTGGYVIFADYNDNASSTTYQNKLFSKMPSIGTDVTSMRSKTTKVVETYENGSLVKTSTDVTYGDYKTSGLGENVAYEPTNYDVSGNYVKTTTTVENENYPYVTSSRKFLLDSTDYLTGDGVSSEYYASSAFKKITDDRTNSASVPKAYTVFTALDSDEVDKIKSEFSDSLTEFKGYIDAHEGNEIRRFPLLIAEDTTRETLTQLINNYLNTLANTNYNYADTSKSDIYSVGLYKCTYQPGTKTFSVDLGTSGTSNYGATACLKKEEVNGKYYFKMDAKDVDTGDIPQFSLVDVMFKNPSASGEVAYHLYVPVYVKKVLRYNFNAEIKSGTDYYDTAYTKMASLRTQAETYRRQGLFENIGNPVTIEFEYAYTRTATEWKDAINAGDSLLTNYYKSLSIKNHNGNGWPGVTRMVLVDANNTDKYYYLDSPPPTDNTQTTYISLYDFTDDGGNRFEPANLQNLMTVTVEQSNSGTLTPTTGNVDEGATVYDGTTYYRPVTDSDSALADSAKFTVTSVTGIKSERYYLTIFTKADKNDSKIYRYEISSPDTFGTSGTGVTYTDEDWIVQNWRANKIDRNTVMHLFIGNLYDNSLTLEVDPQKDGSRVMAADNHYLKVKMTANVALTTNAINSGVASNMGTYGGNGKAEIYQTFLMMYDKYDMTQTSEVGIDLTAGGLIGNRKYYYQGGNISAASFNTETATEVDNPEYLMSDKYVELRNNENLISELSKRANNYAVTLQVSYEMTYAPDDLCIQFPKKEDGTLLDIGSCVIGYSKIASTAEDAANSAAFVKETNATRYYTSDEATASLEYNVVQTDKDYEGYAGPYSYLGINSVETGDSKEYVDTYAVYDTRKLKNTSNYIEFTLTLSNKEAYVKPTVGNPVYQGTALPISDYLTDLKIYGADMNSDGKPDVIFDQNVGSTSSATVVSTKDTYIYKVRVNKSLLRMDTEGVYYIPIDFKVVTGNKTFKSDGLEYSNYKVSLTAAMYSAIDSAESSYSKASYTYNHIIYTNARVISDVFEH